MWSILAKPNLGKGRKGNKMELSLIDPSQSVLPMRVLPFFWNCLSLRPTSPLPPSSLRFALEWLPWPHTKGKTKTRTKLKKKHKSYSQVAKIGKTHRPVRGSQRLAHATSVTESWESPGCSRACRYFCKRRNLNHLFAEDSSGQTHRLETPRKNLKKKS